MNDITNTLSINILDKQYKVKCPPEKVTELRESAQYVDAKMREMNQGNKASGNEKVAVITALNIANEFLEQKRQLNRYIEIMHKRIQTLQAKVETALNTDSAAE